MSFLNGSKCPFINYSDKIMIHEINIHNYIQILAFKRHSDVHMHVLASSQKVYVSTLEVNFFGIPKYVTSFMTPQNIFDQLYDPTKYVTSW